MPPEGSASVRAFLVPTRGQSSSRTITQSAESPRRGGSPAVTSFHEGKPLWRGQGRVPILRLLRGDWELGQMGHKAQWAAGGAGGRPFPRQTPGRLGRGRWWPRRCVPSLGSDPEHLTRPRGPWKTIQLCGSRAGVPTARGPGHRQPQPLPCRGTLDPTKYTQKRSGSSGPRTCVVQQSSFVCLILVQRRPGASLAGAGGRGRGRSVWWCCDSSPK